MERSDSLSKQCDVNDFIEKTKRMPYFGKLNFAGRSKESNSEHGYQQKIEIENCTKDIISEGDEGSTIYS
jgi:hypothetical protein